MFGLQGRLKARGVSFPPKGEPPGLSLSWSKVKSRGGMVGSQGLALSQQGAGKWLASKRPSVGGVRGDMRPTYSADVSQQQAVALIWGCAEKAMATFLFCAGGGGGGVAGRAGGSTFPKGQREP